MYLPTDHATLATMRPILAVVLLFTLAACGGGSGGHKSASEVAKAAGCTSATRNAPSDQEMFLTNSVDCTFNGHDLMIGWFKNSDAMKQYRDTADSLGGAGLAYGSDWVVECHDDEADCAAVVKAVQHG